MKKLLIICMAFWLSLPMFAQEPTERTMQVYSGGKMVYSQAVNLIDSIVFVGYPRLYFNANGGVGSMEPQLIDSETGFMIISANAFMRDNYYFTSWNTQADGSGRSYVEGQYAYFATTDTLYAQWYPVSGQPDATRGEENGHAWVDLGLPSGTKWATQNIGAKSAEDYGYLYAWGETATKSICSWETYAFMDSYDKSTSVAALNKYSVESKYVSNTQYDNKTTLDAEDDVAHVLWGGNWRMPTHAQMLELVQYCEYSEIIQNGVRGVLFTSKTNGNNIFLPVAGQRKDDSYGSGGFTGHYWSNTLFSTNPAYAHCLEIKAYGGASAGMSWNKRFYGNSVRAVLP